jgi:hypothetical protein
MLSRKNLRDERRLRSFSPDLWLSLKLISVRLISRDIHPSPFRAHKRCPSQAIYRHSDIKELKNQEIGEMANFIFIIP